MSYEPTNWKDGDLVTSAKLNKIEQGIAAGGGVLIVHEDENGTLDKTWQEIYDANACVICLPGDSSKVFGFVVEVNTAVQPSGESNLVWFIIMTQDQTVYVASSPDDYPTFQESNVKPSLNEEDIGEIIGGGTST